MSNAWFYYAVPLLIALLAVAFGAGMLRQFLRGAVDARGNKYGPVAGCGGAFFAQVGSTIALAILFTAPMPWTRRRIFQHVFHTPPERIQRFVIKSGGDPPRELTSADVVIDDPERIRKIARILEKAPEISLNHPSVKWRALVQMVTLDGTYYFGVDSTQDGRNGTVVSALEKPKGGHWHLGDVRADGLETILEAAVKAASKP